jgi:hypothetical protein
MLCQKETNPKKRQVARRKQLRRNHSILLLYRQLYANLVCQA